MPNPPTIEPSAPSSAETADHPFAVTVDLSATRPTASFSYTGTTKPRHSSYKTVQSVLSNYFPKVALTSLLAANWIARYGPESDAASEDHEASIEALGKKVERSICDGMAAVTASMGPLGCTFTSALADSEAIDDDSDRSISVHLGPQHLPENGAYPRTSDPISSAFWSPPSIKGFKTVDKNQCEADTYAAHAMAEYIRQNNDKKHIALVHGLPWYSLSPTHIAWPDEAAMNVLSAIVSPLAEPLTACTQKPESPEDRLDRERPRKD